MHQVGIKDHQLVCRIRIFPEYHLPHPFRPALGHPLSHTLVEVYRYYISTVVGVWEWGQVCMSPRSRSRSRDLAPIPNFADCLLLRPCDGLRGLGPSRNEEEIILDDRLGRGLVFDDEIAAWQVAYQAISRKRKGPSG